MIRGLKLKIVIAGAGAMGQMLGLFLTRGGAEVSLVVRRKEVKDVLENQGLSFKVYGEDDSEDAVSKNEPVKIKTYVGSDGIKDCDVVFITAKGTDTEAVLQSIKPIIGGNTYVCSLQNGIGNVDIIKKYVKEENVYYGCMNLSATIVSPGHLEGSLFDGTCIYLGSVVKGRKQEKTGREIAEAFIKGGLSAEYTDDIDKEVWNKLLVNIAVNATCGLVRLRGGEAGTDSDFISVSVDMIKEAIAVAEKLGVHVDFNAFMSQVLPKASKTSGAHYPSMAQDMMVKRTKTEIDFINGAIARLGDELGVPVPVNKTVARLVRTYQNNYSKQFYPKTKGSKPSFTVTVEPKFCKGCEYCVKYCPAKVFEMKERKAVSVFTDKCVGCMSCSTVCPEAAITIEKD